MRRIAFYTEHLLYEDYRRFVSRFNEQYPESYPYSIAEWCELEAQSDPDFYRWILNDPDISDFGGNLSDEERDFILDYFTTL